MGFFFPHANETARVMGKPLSVIGFFVGSRMTFVNSTPTAQTIKTATAKARTRARTRNTATNAHEKANYKMDSYSITNVKYLDPSELHRWMVEGHTTTLQEPFQVVDVRGSDYMGGHIRDGWHFAYSRLKQDPGYLRELKRLLLEKQQVAADGDGDGDGALNVVFHCMLSQQRGPSAAMLLLRSLDTAELPRCRLWVLRGGFSSWQAVYGDDAGVTEGYLADLWR
ncbi:phosphatase YCH1 [Saccharomyces eubayanus]|uniref:phosphatase YCH1 n=1 Tax=Saccharomyces eubayanus TaxID=1080349 RepID=UPI0006C69BA2|nr:YCH1-like protein [Saccharomyces eubayanus]KOG99689.1 YCH1-like protein [Saccharomyces eubayanus]